jgi:hypothetical protein
LKHKQKDLLEDGWMTIDDFVDSLSLGMRDYLHNNWGKISKKDDLHHPEDLATNASIYTEIAYRVLADFTKCRHG